MSDNKDKSAFPVTSHTSDGPVIWETGLTKREYFAGLAMQGLLAGQSIDQKDTDQEASEAYAKTSIMLADELLKQLEK